MKAIELELMKDYRYLSNLYSLKDDLYYTETIADMDQNDYQQSLHRVKTDGSSNDVIYGPEKRVSSFVLNDEIVIYEHADSGPETVYSVLKDGKKEEFLRILVSAGEL